MFSSDDDKTARCPVGDGHVPNDQLARDLLKPDSDKGYESFSSAEALFLDLND